MRHAHSAQFISSTAHARRGMSLMEITMAILVLTVGISVTIGQITSLRNLRASSDEMIGAHAVVSAIAERFQGSRWETIGTTVAPWSQFRQEPNAGPTAVLRPLADDSETAAFIDATDRELRGLQSLGIIAAPTGLPNLRIYVEYYRAMNGLDADGNPDPLRPGMMAGEDVAYANIGAFTQRFRFDQRQEQLPAAERTAILNNRARYRLDQNQAVVGQVGENEPVVVRILATWSVKVGDNRFDIGQMNILTCRKP